MQEFKKEEYKKGLMFRVDFAFADYFYLLFRTDLSF